MSRGRDGTTFRRERIRQIEAMYKKSISQSENGIISLKKFLAKVSYEIGLRQKTAMEYIDVLHALEILEYDIESDFLAPPRTPENQPENADR